MSKPSSLSFQNNISKKPSKALTRRRSGGGGSDNRAGRTFQPKAEEMRWVFDKLDANRDGKISYEEYKKAVKALGDANGATSEDDAAKAFKVLDGDGDGFIDYKEFTEMQSEGGGVKVADIESAFRVFDLDGNGKISAEELLQVLRRMGERCSLDSCRKMVRGVDADGDGFIDMDEFVKMMTGTMKPSAA